MCACVCVFMSTCVVIVVIISCFSKGSLLFLQYPLMILITCSCKYAARPYDTCYDIYVVFSKGSFCSSLPMYEGRGVTKRGFVLIKQGGVVVVVVVVILNSILPWPFWLKGEDSEQGRYPSITAAPPYCRQAVRRRAHTVRLHSEGVHAPDSSACPLPMYICI